MHGGRRWRIGSNLQGVVGRLQDRRALVLGPGVVRLEGCDVSELLVDRRARSDGGLQRAGIGLAIALKPAVDEFVVAVLVEDLGKGLQLGSAFEPGL